MRTGEFSSRTRTRRGRAALFELLASHASGEWWRFCGTAAFTLVMLAADLALPLFVAVAINQGLEGKLSWGLSGLAVTLVASLSAQYLAGFFAAGFSATVEARVQRSLIARALELGLPGRRPFNQGDLLNRIAGDAGAVATLPITILSVASGLMIVAGSIVALVTLNWLFAVILIGVFAAVAVGVLRLVAKLSSAEASGRELTSRMVGAFVDALAGKRTIRAAGTLHAEVERVVTPLSAIADNGERVLRLYGRSAALLLGAHYALLFAVLVAGAWLLSHSQTNVGELLAAIRYSQLAFSAGSDVFDTGWFQLAALRVRAARVMEVLQSPPAITYSARSLPVPSGAGAVDLRDVWSGTASKEVLRGINLQIAARQTVAVVGRSGTGKSTLTALIGRLIEPESGAVDLDGVAVSRLGAVELTRLVAYAFERPHLVGGTIRDTIALGIDATDEDVRAAARCVEAHAFIERLPLGYGTPLRDVPLSGGELQRLGLARAALRKCRVLVLDDALSSLDTATEMRVTSALRRLGAGRTTLIVAHRAATAARADCVVWLVNGRIQRIAPHAELWRDRDYRAVFANSVACDYAVHSAAV